MKTKKHLKSHAKHPEPRLSPGMQKTHEVPKSHLRKEAPSNTYSHKETAGPDANDVPGIRNPQAVQGGLGPTNQDGEGERQNDQLAELEQIEPEE